MASAAFLCVCAWSFRLVSQWHFAWATFERFSDIAHNIKRRTIREDAFRLFARIGENRHRNTE